METKEITKSNKMKKIAISTISAIIAIILIIIIYDRITINNTYNIGDKNLEIPIFVYHNIVKDESEIEYDYMQTTDETFEKQINGLQKCGYHFINYEDLKEYSEGKKELYKKSCIVTFDDGYSGVYENAYPIAQKYNIPITMFVITDNIGNSGIINWEEAKEMQGSGLVTIASHSTNHPEFTTLSAEEAKNNVDESYRVIEENLGTQELKIFTYPYGLNTDDERKILKEEGYVQNLTDNKINKSKELDLYGLHRCYPLSDSIYKMVAKIIYRSVRY